jgi:hypothetical protein
MQTIATVIDIDAAIDRVWLLLTDTRNYAEWNPYLVEVRGNVLTDAVVEMLACSAAGERTALRIEVNRAEPYEMVWVGGLDDYREFRGEHWFVLEPRGNGTRLNHFEHFTGSRAEQIVTALGAVIEDNFERMNRALKARAEQPFDGG